MKKKDKFFACLFMVCYVVSAVVMAGDYLCKMLERDWNHNHMQHLVDAEGQGEDSEQLSASENNKNDDINEDEQTGSETESSEGEPQNGSETEIVSGTEVLEEPEDQMPEYQTVGYEYFDDALFIGDSRTVGLMEYGNLENATFFADSGMSVYGLAWKKISVPGKGKVTFDEVLTEKQYGKIYLMLGMNELGYRFDTTKERYQETLEKILAAQENAIIYLCANMHVTAEQSAKDEIYNNENVNLINELIAGLTDGEKIFYLDVNELFDDENGALSEEYTSDAFHVLGKYYEDWIDWLCTKAILPQADEPQNEG